MGSVLKDDIESSVYQELADILNAMDGPKRSAAHWRRSWHDQLYHAKKVANSEHYRSNQRFQFYTEIDQRLFAIDPSNWDTEMLEEVKNVFTQNRLLNFL